jgi:hypothetical protein
MNFAKTRTQVAIGLAMIACFTVGIALVEHPANGLPRASAASKDTPVPSDGLCDFVNYHHNEAKNEKGPSKCASDCDCDGMRSCTSGVCSGKARPATLTAATCNSKDYHYNESWTPAGPSKCTGDCECDGLRTCVSGQCKGTAR